MKFTRKLPLEANNSKGHFQGLQVDGGCSKKGYRDKRGMKNLNTVKAARTEKNY